MNCKICNGKLKLLGIVPFDRNNAGVPIIDDTNMEYHQCTSCQAISCQEMLTWTPEKLGEKVYNEEYINYDPDYGLIRPSNFARYLFDEFKNEDFSHLDFGAGNGTMSKMLKKAGWNSAYYDPYVNNILPKGKFDLITAIEVVEHSLDVEKTFIEMKSFLNKNGAILFTTQLVPTNVNIFWWYLGTRNGHINIMSKKSLDIIADRLGFKFSSLNANIHVFQRTKNAIRKFYG